MTDRFAPIGKGLPMGNARNTYIYPITVCLSALMLGGCFDSVDSGAASQGTTNTPGNPGTPATAGSPTISGNPATAVTVDQSYSFQPVAVDPDGDALSFTIANLPSWATFDANTGLLSGTPAQGDSAVYNDIQISVSDGGLSAALPPFSISVNQVGTGSATLTWTPPTVNTDGSPLNDLVAYKFYYGTTQGTYTDQVRVDNPGLTSYVLDNLSTNTYYIVSTSINSANVESAYSNEALITIN